VAIVKMPQLGESVTEGTILQWLKQPGDPVKFDDPLCEIETEKVTAELPSEFEGTMGRILVPEGETVEVGTPLCEIAVAGEDAAPQEAAPKAAAEPAALARQAEAGARGGGWAGGPMAISGDAPPLVGPAVAAARPELPPSPNGGAVSSRQPDTRERFYSPAVMRLAREHNVDLSAIVGTGAGGRVTRKDIEAWVKSGGAGREPVAAGVAAPGPAAPAARPAPAPGAYEVVQLSPTRRTIAENLKRSNIEAPQAWTMVEADVTALVALREREREQFSRREGVELTLLPYFTAAVCEALRKHPELNARWEGEELRRYSALNIGVAVATETGLVVPVIHGAGDLSVAGLAKRIADLAQRAHSRKLRLEDIEGGTFTVNNTGTFGSVVSKPIVNYPQVGIVTMERVVKRPVVVEGDAIAVRSMMNVCLSFDHRALDGLEAGAFLADLKRSLEAMGRA
jgi:2-oxoisovalerate dehydrogenase E2 component (dihydrolipoyl transacylase)